MDACEELLKLSTFPRCVKELSKLATRAGRETNTSISFWDENGTLLCGFVARGRETLHLALKDDARTTETPYELFRDFLLCRRNKQEAA